MAVSVLHVVTLVALAGLGGGCTRHDPPPGHTPAGTGGDAGSHDDTGGVDDPGGGDDGGDAPDDTGPTVVDQDGDGFPAELDCDDTDPAVFPGAAEVCGDGRENDCDTTWETADAVCRGQLLEDAFAWVNFSNPGESFHRTRGIGDVDGDGKDDFAVGVTDATGDIDGDGQVDDEPDAYFAGVLYVVTEPPAGPVTQGAESARVLGDQYSGSLGWDIVGLGDVNGDGYGDIAVGASEATSGSVSTWWETHPSLYRIDGPVDIDNIGDALVMLDYMERVTCTGSVLETMGDQDGDGTRDLLVGSRCAGEVHLLSTGVDETQDRDADALAHLVGPGGDSRFGHAIGSGDLNGDGVEDVVVGTPDRYGLWQGFAAVFHGPVRSTVDHSDADSTIQVQAADSIWDASLFGTGVSVGDLDGDGHADLAVSAPIMDDEESTPVDGAIFVYLGPVGSRSSAAEADIRISGRYLVSEGYHRPEDQWGERPLYGDWGVGGPVHADTDLDGDGATDLLFGCGNAEVNGTSSWIAGSTSRRAWVFTGPLEAGAYLAEDADHHLGGDPSPGSTQALGSVVDILGDTDGDGRPEISLAAPSPSAYLFELTETPFP